MRLSRLHLSAMVAAIGLSWLLVTPVAGQPAPPLVGPTFSIDFQGPTCAGPGPFVGRPDGFFGLPIDEGTILTPMAPGPPGPNPPGPGPLPPPGIMASAVAPPAPPPNNGVLGIRQSGVGALEVDALSYGRDAMPAGGVLGTPMQMMFFSVDEWAVGDVASGPGPSPPNVFTEGMLNNAEASADVFQYLGPVGVTAPPPPPLPPPGPNNTAWLDGDGMMPWGGPGLGLIEPNPPAPGVDRGDNLDGLDMNTRLTQFVVGAPIFYSMDSAFPDPLEGAPGVVNSGTAPANFDVVTGTIFSGGDVVVTTNPTAGGGPTLYAGAAALGLDLAGFDTDDLDALSLRDDGALDPKGNPFFAPGIDEILFSVRRGSAVIGTRDSAFGIPIEEGDVLTIPVAPGAPPAMYITAEALGLGTIRSGTTGGMNYGDDLNALDVFSPQCDLNYDGVCDVNDINTLYSAGNLTLPGVAPMQTTVDFDLTIDMTIDVLDLKLWLQIGAAANGFATPYRQGDTELDRDVDITDFNTLAGNFDPGGINGAANTWDKGNFNGDFDIDIGDFNDLASNFAPGGYDDASAAVTADADPGQVDLVVDLATGEVVLDGNAAAISGLQVFSAGNSLLATDFTADVLQFVISTNTSTYAEGAFVNTGVDGLISLGIMYDLFVDAQDLTFEYTMIGQPTVQGTVIYIPEPGSLAIAGVFYLLFLRRRRCA